MSIIVKENFNNALGEQQKEIRKFVLEGYAQIIKRQYKDFDTVCERLEEKYSKCSSIR